MRWPATWTSPAALSLVQGTAIDCLLIEKGPALDGVARQAQEKGLQVVDPAALPAGVRRIEGVWPGVQMGRGNDRTSAGPTGNPWIDSNAWKIRLEAALRPATAIWVDAVPKGNVPAPGPYLLALADAASCGGRWILNLDNRLAAGIASQNDAALATWKSIAGAAGFFRTHAAWAGYVPEAIIGVVSDFTGDNEFMGQEMLNLLARANQQYRIIVKSRASADSWKGLRAVIYVDAAPPDAALRNSVMSFVQAGGMVIAGPKWGTVPGPAANGMEHPRYQCITAGKGKVALAKSYPDDPYVFANDSVVLISHRYELVRFWNSGAVGSYLAASPGRKRAVAHLFFYSGRPDASSVRIAGPYRSAKLLTFDQAEARAVEFQRQKDALELHLPQLGQYAAVELEV